MSTISNFILDIRDIPVSENNWRGLKFEIDANNRLLLDLSIEAYTVAGGPGESVVTMTLEADDILALRDFFVLACRAD